MNKEWFEMRPLIRPRLARAMWVTLHAYRDQTRGDYSRIGWTSDSYALRSIAVPLASREDAAHVLFTDLPHTHEGYAEETSYRECDEFHWRDHSPLGWHLALHRHLDDDDQATWSLSQDFVAALRLKQEGDTWVRPCEGYAEVAKVLRTEDDSTYSIAVKPDYLADYLSARQLALGCYLYRDRRATLALDSWAQDWLGEQEERREHGGTFLGRAWTVEPESWHLLHIARNDKWEEDELPILDDESDENIRATSSTGVRDSEPRLQVEGRYTRLEWVEPAPVSPRVRRDRSPSGISFVVDASGLRMSADDLNREEIGRWLWFRPDVIRDILGRRGANLTWYTRFTGGASLSRGYSVHFGINEPGFIVAYAQGPSKLPEWQRQVWSGYNVAPVGGLSDELEAAQVRSQPAGTHAPEAYLLRALDALDESFCKRFGCKLFRDHLEKSAILRSCHRFRSLDRAGLLALAKDVARLTADMIDTSAVLGVVGGAKVGSLKSLERALETVAGPERARELMSTYVGVYELRLGDAHLPSQDINQAFDLVEVYLTQPWIHVGAQLLHNVVRATFDMANALVSASRD